MYRFLANVLAIAITIVILIAQVSSENAGSAGTIDSDNVVKEFYDFVIVGGGTAGCVLANRLSEKFSVLVLEEGGLPPEEFDIPALLVGSLYKTSPAIKHYFTVPQKNAGLDSNNGRMEYMIGKILGGGSQVNGMAFNRGSPHDYDNWANLTGDPSWKYENLLKYFKRIEDYDGNFTENISQHGKGGPIPISDPKYMPGFEALMEAGNYFGYPSRRDPNGPEIPSFAPFEWSQRKGRRVSSYRGYILPIIQSRPKLTILTEAKVVRIIFDISNKRAIGVTFTRSPGEKSGTHPDESMEIRYVGANKEVIISAGVIDSPAILMRSGIGPLDVLEATKIPVVKILPVGRNLHDHLLFKVDFLVNRNTSAGIFIPEIDLNQETWKEYQETGDGPYSCLAGENAQIFWVSGLRLKEDWPNPEWADAQFFHSQMATNFHPEDKHVTIYTRPYLTRPKSRGRVTLNISDVDAMPLIDFQFLSDPDDMQILVEAAKTIVKLYENAPSFKKQGCRVKDKQDINCDGGNLEFGSDEYWKCVIRDRSACGLHGGGTCRMGNEVDPEAVVDTRLRVIGVEGLRVVDLSVAPQVTNTNTQPVAYVVAEKAVEMIKEDWNSECKGGGGGSGGGDMPNCF